MDQFGGPAALGGVIAGLMLAAWMLGRWQGGLRAAPPRREPLARNVPRPQDLSRALAAGGREAADARPCQQAARDERRAALAGGPALGELHADISAYRRAQQVLAEVEIGELSVNWSATGAGAPCRYMGISGEPTCPVLPAAGAGCALGACPAEGRAADARAAQPSVEAAVFTRV